MKTVKYKSKEMETSDLFSSHLDHFHILNSFSSTLFLLGYKYIAFICP